MIVISPNLSLDDSELVITFIRASGPGGQNVNKVATAAQLRFDVTNSPSLPAEVKTRLKQLAGSRMTSEGMLLIEAKRYRTQEQNRLDAEHRLVPLIQRPRGPTTPRHATRPSLSAKAARVDEKKKRGEVKRTRRSSPEDWD